MSFVKRFIIIFAILVSCVGCDQTTKSIAKSVLSESETSSYFQDTVRLHLVYNNGAFLGLGSSLPEVWREGIFTVGVAILLIGALVYAFFSKPGCFSSVLAIALIFSGGLSNLLDRIAYHGLVVDFINIGIGSVRSGIFNIADIAITMGIFILFSRTFHQQSKER